MPLRLCVFTPVINSDFTIQLYDHESTDICREDI
jgi:hypothetical protein